MKITKRLLGLVLLIGLLSFASTEWERLGVRKVNFGIDKDVISLGIVDARFTKLKVDVTGSLNMHKMKVHYGNGTSQEISIKHNFIKGSNSRVIDLKGNKRIIKKVEFWYDTKNKAKRKATLKLFGRK